MDVGTISDCLVGEWELAQYFLSILNSSEEYKKWAELSCTEIAEHPSHSDLEMKRKRRYPSDHTQVQCCLAIVFTYSIIFQILIIGLHSRLCTAMHSSREN